jgi:electron transfer flavoprotein alpha subunit
MTGSVTVLAEARRGRLEKVTLELLEDARKIAGFLRGRVEIVLPGSEAAVAGARAELGPYLKGERLHAVVHPLLEHFSTEPYLEALTPVLRGAAVLMVGATADGRDLAPRLAARLGMGYAPHVLTVGAAPGGLAVTRVTHGGRVGVQTSWAPPVLLTMRPGVGDLPERAARPSAEVVTRAPELRPGRVRHVKHLPPDPATQDIRDAERVVAGGRGVGSREGFGVVRELADALGASVAASRMAVDLGWAEFPRQVGQTGKTVAPKLYVAVGISGASHHLMGMRGSEKILAVNTDKAAPIFSVSHFGAVGDLHEVLPRLARKIRDHHGNHAGH